MNGLSRVFRGQIERWLNRFFGYRFDEKEMLGEVDDLSIILNTVALCVGI